MTKINHPAMRTLMRDTHMKRTRISAQEATDSKTRKIKRREKHKLKPKKENSGRSRCLATRDFAELAVDISSFAFSAC